MDIKFAVTLTPEGRTEAARKAITAYFADHDIALTGGGLTTQSYLAPAAAFDAMFGTDLSNLNQDTRPGDAIGGGILPDIKVTPPDAIAPFIYTLSIAPPARRMTGGL